VGRSSLIHTPDAAKERVSPPTYSFIYRRQLGEGGDFHVRNTFIPEDAEYVPEGPKSQYGRVPVLYSQGKYMNSTTKSNECQDVFC